MIRLLWSVLGISRMKLKSDGQGRVFENKTVDNFRIYYSLYLLHNIYL